MDLQSKLLRFIQTGSFQQLGGSRLETVNVRFVCATNRDPLAEVKAGRFREDLYYRLHVIGGVAAAAGAGRGCAADRSPVSATVCRRGDSTSSA